jgi:hypothetical protein
VSESVLQKMAPLVAEAVRAFRIDPSYIEAMALDASTQKARREARSFGVGPSPVYGV